MTTITQVTPGQVKQISRFGSDATERALEELGLDNPGAQRVIEHGDEFASAIREAALASLKDLSVTDKFKNEEIHSSYAYPNGYKVKDIAEQVATLRRLFPELKDATFDESITMRPLPPNAEGWFAIPRWEKLGSTYGEAIDKMLTTIKSKRTFYNYREGQTSPEYLRQHAKTVKAFQKLGNEQKGHDILIVPCQFGLRHRGRSVRRTHEVFQSDEFGLGAFAVGCMLLTHPEREVQWKQLHVDCAGDEFSPGAVGRFGSAPCFGFIRGRVGFVSDHVSGARGGWGSASGFLPQ